MTDLELVVSFAALLCGLLLANVGNNIGDALRSRRDLPIGFVPWAINAYISLAVITLFTAVAGVSDSWASFGTSVMVVQCAMVLPFVIVSRLLCPEHKDRWASIEEYYIANRKLILGIMLISPVSYVLGLTVYTPELVQTGPVLLFASLPVIVTMIALMFAPTPIWHRAGWSFLIAHRMGVTTWLAVMTG